MSAAAAAAAGWTFTDKWKKLKQLWIWLSFFFFFCCLTKFWSFLQKDSLYLELRFVLIQVYGSGICTREIGVPTLYSTEKFVWLGSDITFTLQKKKNTPLSKFLIRYSISQITKLPKSRVTRKAVQYINKIFLFRYYGADRFVCISNSFYNYNQQIE